MSSSCVAKHRFASVSFLFSLSVNFTSTEVHFTTAVFISFFCNLISTQLYTADPFLFLSFSVLLRIDITLKVSQEEFRDGELAERVWRRGAVSEGWICKSHFCQTVFLLVLKYSNYLFPVDVQKLFEVVWAHLKFLKLVYNCSAKLRLFFENCCD